MIDKSSFDIAMMPGARQELANAYSTLRSAETKTQIRYLQDNGQLIDGIYYCRNCPICQTSNGKTELKIKTLGLHYLTCKNCEFTYSYEVLKMEIDRKRYVDSPATKQHYEIRRAKTYQTLEKRKAQYILQSLNNLWTSNSSYLLDVGCATGILLYEAQKIGWIVAGIEATQTYFEFCKSKGLNITLGFFPEDMPKQKYDVITLLDVLEHMPDPLNFLSKTKNYLNPGGMLVVQVPNLNSLLVEIEGKENNNFCYGHWSFFTYKSLNMIMERNGFQLLHNETIITELDKILSYNEEKIKSAFEKLTNIRLNNLSDLNQEEIYKQELGYKILGFFKH